MIQKRGSVPAALNRQKPASEFSLWSVLTGARRHLWLAAILSAAMNVLHLAPSLYMMQVYDRVLLSGSFLTLTFLSLVLVLALLSLSGLDAIRSRIMTRLGLYLDQRLSPTLMRTSLSARAEGREDAQANVMRDLEALRQTVSSTAVTTALDLPWTPLYLAVCFLVHPIVGWVGVGGALLLFGLALGNDLLSRRALRASAERQPAHFTALDGDLRLAESMRALGMTDSVVSRRLEERLDLLEPQTRASMQGASFTAAIKFTRMVLQSAMLAVGASLAIQQEISSGAIIACTILTARAFAPVEQTVGAWRQLSLARYAWKSISKVWASTATQVARTALPRPQRILRVEGVSTTLPGAQRPILSNIAFEALAGQIVGIVGPSGAGKSTLARVLANAAQPRVGCVRLDGASYADWDDQALARHIGYLPQSIDLMPGTIAENISRFCGPNGGGRSEELSSRIIAAAQAAGAHEMILQLPEAYETRLGSDGRGLSVGQCQRIGLARALFDDPFLLVLDEPNAHLDQTGEAALIQALRAVRARGGLVFVVAHRASVMAAADRIISLNQGRIVDDGSRDQVFAKLAVANGAIAQQAASA